MSVGAPRPTALCSSQLSTAASKARKAVDWVANRHRAKFSKWVLAEASADPEDDDKMNVENSEAELQIWRLLPQLKSLPESLLGKIPLTAMFQLNTAL